MAKTPRLFEKLGAFSPPGRVDFFLFPTSEGSLTGEGLISCGLIPFFGLQCSGRGLFSNTPPFLLPNFFFFSMKNSPLRTPQHCQRVCPPPPNYVLLWRFAKGRTLFPPALTTAASLPSPRDLFLPGSVSFLFLSRKKVIFFFLPPTGGIFFFFSLTWALPFFDW